MNVKRYFKAVILIINLISIQIIYAQEHACSREKQKGATRSIRLQQKSTATSAQIVHENKYDVKFVHLNLNLERTNKNVSGNVRTVATVTSSVLDTFQTLLHQNLIIDSLKFNSNLLSFIRQDSMVKAKPATVLANGTSFTVDVFYHGTPPVGGSAIGSGFSNGTSGAWGNQATWSLSESLVAYHWWPTKQQLTDKIDSSWVFVTTDSTNKVGSNGLLKNVVIIGNKKRYEWKSRYMIDYYLISVAIAKYKELKQYAKPQYLPNDSIFIQNYIYDNAINNNSWINNQKPSLNTLPQVMSFLCNMYGMYPFYKEKYGHAMAPFSGGMEHQTMSSMGFFEYYINAHELGHQWWGNNVTCKSWGDIWINEGFASYTEQLVAQYLDPANFAINLAAAHMNVMSQPGGSVFFTNQDTMNANRIFSSRLTYDKGGAIVHSLRFLTNNDSLWFNMLRGFQNTYKNSTASALDFQNYYQNFTSINPTQFFSQWYYGEGYPTFNIKYNYTGTQFILKSSQTVSRPSVTPLFITPLEYKLTRSGKPDTTIKVMHTLPTEIYTLNISGTITSVSCDPNNWIINQANASRDATLGINIEEPPTNTTTVEESTMFKEIKVGPNPVKTNLTITNGFHAEAEVLIVDITGKIVLTQKLSDETTVNFSALSAGVYHVKIIDQNGREQRVEKVIKQ